MQVISLHTGDGSGSPCQIVRVGLIVIIYGIKEHVSKSLRDVPAANLLLYGNSSQHHKKIRIYDNVFPGLLFHLLYSHLRDADVCIQCRWIHVNDGESANDFWRQAFFDKPIARYLKVAFSAGRIETEALLFWLYC